MPREGSGGREGGRNTGRVGKNTSRKDKSAARIRGKPKEGYGAGKAGRRGKA